MGVASIRPGSAPSKEARDETDVSRRLPALSGSKRRGYGLILLADEGAKSLMPSASQARAGKV